MHSENKIYYIVFLKNYFFFILVPGYKFSKLNFSIEKKKYKNGTKFFFLYKKNAINQNLNKISL
jgi:hypothetical protein